MHLRLSALAILSVALAGLAAYSTAAFVRMTAGQLGLMDSPNDRSSHSSPTPKGGGLGIVLGVLGGVAAKWMVDPAGQPGWVGPLIVGGVLIAGVSLLDDIKGVRPIHRLLVHFAVAGGVVRSLDISGGLAPLSFGDPLLDTAEVILGVLWVAWMTNAFNFMDGIDGIAASQAMAAGLAFAAVGWLAGDGTLAITGLFVVSTSVAFLTMNWHPASVFMGDVGSAFLGYLLAVLSLVAVSAEPSIRFGLFVPLWPFLFDPTYTLVMRISRREKVLHAHRSHLYQRLVIAGASHANVALLYAALATLGSASYLLAPRMRYGGSVLIHTYLVVSALLVLFLVRRRESMLPS